MESNQPDGSESTPEQRETASNYIKVTAGKLVLGVAITATTFGAAVGNLFDRIMPPRPQQTIERVYEPSGPKMSDEIVDMERSIRTAVKRAVENKASRTELTVEIIEILQRKVFLNAERLEEVREFVKEFFIKSSELALEELLAALKGIVRESVFGESNPGTRRLPSPSPTVSLPTQTATPQR